MKKLIAVLFGISLVLIAVLYFTREKEVKIVDDGKVRIYVGNSLEESGSEAYTYYAGDTLTLNADSSINFSNYMSENDDEKLNEFLRNIPIDTTDKRVVVFFYKQIMTSGEYLGDFLCYNYTTDSIFDIEENMILVGEGWDEESAK